MAPFELNSWCGCIVISHDSSQLFYLIKNFDGSEYEINYLYNFRWIILGKDLPRSKKKLHSLSENGNENQTKKVN